jgi:predicted metal-binding protein
MSKEIVTEEVVRSYRAPWKGQLVLVCRKCQKKLKHSGKKNGIAKLGKGLKKRARHDEDGLKLHVIEVPCLKLCPKGGVTVCTQRQLGRGECSIVRTAADVDVLLNRL